MSKSDFFSFITSLRPIELKAIGELSQTLHLEEGFTVFQSGDFADAVYIINRGTLELVHEGSDHLSRTPVSYLSRGDMFGETETLSGVVRKNAVRTCESASIQCFKKKDFPELIRRVPAFFYYLSQQLASQITKITDLAFVQSNCLELSGNLANFDMVTVYQTILNSAQTGELSVVNENKETCAVFSFVEGQTKYARFYHLTGEEAFWQLFLHEKLAGTFSFAISDPIQMLDGPVIHRNPTDLLITGLQYRDEFKMLMDELPDPASLMKRVKLNLDWSDPECEGLRPVAEAIWQTCYSSVMTVAALCQQLPFCELKFFKTILELVRSGHFQLLPVAETHGVAV